jgi:phage tail-like protein
MSPSKRSSSRTTASSSSDAGRGRGGPLAPLGRSNFVVDWGARSAVSQSFSEVVFPRFLVDADARGGAAPADGGLAGGEHLILRRGATGALDLYDWWDRARRGQAPRRRVVTVQLLDPTGRDVLMTWRFREARPVSLTYSPLLAMEAGVLMETIEIAFHAVEMA